MPDFHSDPGTDFEYTSQIFDNDDFVGALHNSLRIDGITAIQIGEMDATSLESMQVNEFIDHLKKAGFQCVLEYDEMHGRLSSPWRYLVVMKDEESRGRWYGSEADMSLYLHNRIVRDISGGLPLRHFDGATMVTYSTPSRVAEERFCRAHPDDCEPVFNPETRNHPMSAFEVKTSGVGGGRGIFTLEDIAKDDFLGVEESVHGMFLPPMTHELLFQRTLPYVREHAKFLQTLANGYINGYGMQDSFFVSFSRLSP